MSACCNNGYKMLHEVMGFKMWLGLIGPVGPEGPPGRSVELRGPVASVYDLPVTAPASELWQVGTQAPYNGYFFNGAAWVNLGPVAAGATFTPAVSSAGVISWTNDGSLPNPEPVNIKGPTGATPDLQIGTVETGAPGSAAEASITGTPEEPRLNLTLPQGQQGPAVPLSDATPLMDGTASAGTGTSAARADHRHPTDTSRASAAALATYVRPNLLDNWYFVGGGSQQGYGVFPVNQRGQTSYTGGVYGLDRWKVSNSNGSVSVGSQNITFSSASGTSDFRQIINGVSALLGKKLTLSILLNEGLYAITGTVPSTIPSSETTVVYGYILGSNQAGIWIRVSSDGIVAQCRAAQGTPLNMIAVKLEIGDTQTLAHQENGVWVLNEIPDYSEELYKCCTSHADSSDPYTNKSVQYVEDTGWVDLSSYVNTSVFAIRTGFAPAIRIINGVMYYKGELYITTQPSQTAGQSVTMLSGIPSAYRPSAQISAAGFTFSNLTGYFIFADIAGAIQVSAESYAPTEQYYGFSLSMLSGNLK